MTLETITRRGFLKLGAGVLALAATPAFLHSAQAAGKELTLEEVTKDLQREPRDILNDVKDSITFIDYDKQGKWKQKYFDEVFQEDSKEKKPVLAMFYDRNNDLMFYHTIW